MFAVDAEESKTQTHRNTHKVNKIYTFAHHTHKLL